MRIVKEMDPATEVVALCSAANIDPDLAFIDLVISHHQSAIDASRVVLALATHQEFRDFARNVVTAQQQPIRELKTICQDLERLADNMHLGQTCDMHIPYSRDLQDRALHQLDAGRPVHEVAALFGVHRTTLLRWRKRRSAGTLAPRPRTGRTPKIAPVDEPQLIAQVQATPDATLREHGTAWEAATGVAVSEATMCRALQKIGWSLKKRV